MQQQQEEQEQEQGARRATVQKHGESNEKETKEEEDDPLLQQLAASEDVWRLLLSTHPHSKNPQLRAWQQQQTASATMHEAFRLTAMARVLRASVLSSHGATLQHLFAHPPSQATNEQHCSKPPFPFTALQEPRLHPVDALHRAWHALQRSNLPHVNGMLSAPPPGTRAAQTEADRLSDFFMEDLRMQCRHTKAAHSPMEEWASAPAALYASGGNTIDGAAAALFRACRCVPRFRPTLARALFTMHRAKRIVDVSMGWGDRLLAALSLPWPVTYFGLDPWCALHARYRDMQDVLDPQRRHTCHFFTAALEDACALPSPWSDVACGTMDFVIACVPRMLEDGDEDITPPAAPAALQAQVRYEHDTAAWGTRFLPSLLQWGMWALAPGGTLCLGVTPRDRVHLTQLTKRIAPVLVPQLPLRFRAHVTSRAPKTPLEFLLFRFSPPSK